MIEKRRARAAGSQPRRRSLRMLPRSLESLEERVLMSGLPKWHANRPPLVISENRTRAPLAAITVRPPRQQASLYNTLVQRRCVNPPRFDHFHPGLYPMLKRADRIAPEVRIDQPLPNAILADAVEVTGRVTDNSGAVAKVEVRLVAAGTNPENVPPMAIPFDSRTGAFLYRPSLALDGSDDGDYLIQIRARDCLGNVSLWQATPFTLRTRPAGPQVDLTISQVDPSALLYDGETLQVSGTVTAQVNNLGPAAVTAPFDVLFFDDIDFDHLFNPAVDTELGTVRVTAPVPAGGSLAVQAPLSGPVLFAGNIVGGFVDSSSEVAESDEANNLAHSGQDCIAVPQPGSFDPVIEWQRSTFTVAPTSDQVMMTPAVIDLDGDGSTEIVFTTFAIGTQSGGDAPGVLRAVRGSDGTDVWNVSAPPFPIEAFGGIAVGDIDGDGRPEILVNEYRAGRLLAFEHDGTFKWRSPVIATGLEWGSASLADLDHDGTPEIIIGDAVLNADGTIRWNNSSTNALHKLTAVADIDLDGSPEIITGGKTYRADGTLYWDTGFAIAYPAVGNFDADPQAEIVMVSSSSVSLYEHDGTIKWGPVAIPGGGTGGAPTIADMDGDGQAEIGVAGASRYVVYETAGTVKWQQTTQDNSSQVTGSSVFDFEGDGQAEVIYNDEQFLRIYRGSDGLVLYQLAKGSGTTYEYPLVADVDNDGNAEVVAVANNYAFGNQKGVLVIGDLNDTWVSTRSIWNQHTYHIGNVNDDGTIPQNEPISWQVHNSYRLNAQPGANALLAPDLVPSFIRTSVNAGDLTITVRIGSAGAVDVPAAANVSFYDGDPQAGGSLLGTVPTGGPIAPGQFQDVSLTILDLALISIWVVADDNGQGRGLILECRENNNLAVRTIGVPD